MGEEAGMGEGKEPLDRRDQLRKLIEREVCWLRWRRNRWVREDELAREGAEQLQIAREEAQDLIQQLDDISERLARPLN